MRHLDITVKGKVQGVFYRVTTKAVADQLGVRGSIKNDPNGDVIIEAEADKYTLDIFLDWCNQAPEKAKVTSLETK